MSYDGGIDWALILQDETEIDLFRLKCLQARQYNAAVCREHRILFDGDKMTPEEEWFSKLFAHETVLVQSMDDLTLRAHREELAQTCKLGRIKHSAATAEEDRRKKKINTTVAGFERDVNVDVNTTDAINTIKKRQAKLTKAEKLIKMMVNAGISQEYAENAVRARNIKDVIDENAKLKTDGFKVDESRFDVSTKLTQNIDNVSDNREQPKKIFNPFEKK